MFDNSQCSSYFGRTYELERQVPAFFDYTSNPFVLMTFHTDGTTRAVDNAEEGFRRINSSLGPGPPFSSELGEWRCVGSNKILVHSAVYLFVPIDPAQPSRLLMREFVFNFTSNGEFVHGTHLVREYLVGTFPADPGAHQVNDTTFGPYSCPGRRYRFFK